MGHKKETGGLMKLKLLLPLPPPLTYNKFQLQIFPSFEIFQIIFLTELLQPDSHRKTVPLQFFGYASGNTSASNNNEDDGTAHMITFP